MSVRGLFAGAGSQPTEVAASYRYWRIYITETQGGALALPAIAEIELRETLGGADLTSPSTSSSASSSFDDGAGTVYEPVLAIDNQVASYWVAGGYTPQWLRIDMQTAKIVRQIAITPYSGSSSNTPKSWSIQGSSDGSTFTTVKTFTNEASWTGLKTFNL